MLETFLEVQDCIACGQRHAGIDTDEQVLLFLKMNSGLKFDDSLKTRIQQAIRSQLSARHVPAHIMEVTDIPYTLNGKKIENVISDIVNGRKPRAMGVIANPECLNEYKRFATLPKAGVQSKL